MQRRKPAALLAVVAALALAGAAAALYSPSSPVLQLTPSNFKSKVLPYPLPPAFPNSISDGLGCGLLRLFPLDPLGNRGVVSRMVSLVVGSELERGGACGILRTVVRSLPGVDAHVGEGRHGPQRCRHGGGPGR